MEKHKDDLLTISPLESYSPPKLPLLKNVGKNSLILRNLPSRWRNKAKVMTCLGVLGIGVLALSGCNDDDVFVHHGGAAGVPFYVKGETEQEVNVFVPTAIVTENLELRAHYGGSGAGPWYVLYITEQEVLSIIRSQLEAVGLRFDSAAPDNTVTIVSNLSMATFGIDLFDASKGVAITQVGSWRGFVDEVKEGFEMQISDISFGVFYTPGLNPDSEFNYKWEQNYHAREGVEPSDKEVAEASERARPILEEQLNERIEDFIVLLQSEGIIK